MLSVEGDRSRALTPDEAVRYGRAVFAVAAAADYEEAVYGQLLERGVPQAAALNLLSAMRAARPSFDDEAMAPLRWEPGLNPQGKGFIRLEMDGRPIGQLTAEDARGHSAHVLEAVPNAELDAVYRRLLVATIGLSDREARAVVDHLGTYRTGE